MFVVVVMIVAAAGAVRTMIVVVVMFIMVVIMMMFVLIVVMVVMTVLVLIVVVIVMMFMLLMIVIMVMMFMLLMIVIVVVMIVMCGLFKELLELVIKCILLCHSVNKLLACELVPLSSNYRSSRILLTEALYALVQLILRKTACVAENKAACIGYLIVEELAEVLHVHLVLLCVNNCSEAVKLHIVSAYVLNSTDNIAELANSGGLDEDTVGMIFLEHLLQSLAEISHKTTADTAGIHLSYLDTGILQEASVYTNVTELILDEHQLFALVALVYELLDKGSLTGSKKAGENSYLCHISALLSLGYRRINGR